MANNFPSDKDKALFRKAMACVTPLQKSEKDALLPEEKTIRKQSTQEQAITHKANNVCLSDYFTEEVQADTLLSYCSHGLPNKRLRDLRSGKIPWEARLDLHGQRVDAARDSLIQFIERQATLGHRCLLIIHGKGNHNGKAPILKNLVNRWLPQFQQVLAFHSALARDGGSGALYVLLKRS